MRLYSFDIFDTLVERRVAQPIGIFSLVEHKIANWESLDVALRRNFAHVRRESELLVRESMSYSTNGDVHEVTFDEIYRMIALDNNLSASDVERLKALEIECEIANLLLIEERVEQLKSLLAEGCRVVLISDMYYGERELRRLLTSLDPIFEGVKIYSSADYRCSKFDSRLYAKVQQAEGVEYSEWSHYGDNETSDIKTANRCGIDATHTPASPQQRYEQQFLGQCNDLDTQMVAGSARLAHSSDSAVYRLGATFAAPLLYGYAEWIIERAERLNIDVVYFIARDGYIVQRIVEQIVALRGLTLRCVYLYGSRRAWRLPDNEIFDEHVDWIFEEFSDRMSLRFVAERLGVEVEILSQYQGGDLDRVLRDRELMTLKSTILNSDELRGAILESIANKRALLREYLEQMIDLTKDSILLVDINGSGRTTDMLRLIMPEIKATFYTCFFIRSYVRDDIEFSKKLTYLKSFDYRHPVIEAFARTLDGQTIGYRRGESGRIEPILESVNSQYMIDWGYEDYLRGVDDYVRNIVASQQINGYMVNSTPYTISLLRYMHEAQDRELLSVVGSIPLFRDIGDESNVRECAPPLTLWQALLGRKRMLSFITIARSNSIYRAIYRFSMKYDTLFGFFFSIVIREKDRIAYVRILGIKHPFHQQLWRQ